MRVSSLGWALLILLLLVSPRWFSSATASTPDPPTVTVATYSGAVSTYQDYLAISASVMSGGVPVANALVTFSDSFNEQFHGSTASTNSSGVALTEMQFSNGNSGTDTITASVTVAGQSATGQTTVDVLPYGSTQLWVTAAIWNSGANGGSSGVISGTVYAYSFGVSHAKVTVSDTIGSTFPSLTMFSGGGGFYSLNFTLGKPKTSVTDLITVAVSASGYSGSSTTTEVEVYPYGSNSLTVNLDAFYPNTYSTYLNYAVVQAEVSGGGMAVSGVQVTFSDSLAETFQGATATTDAYGKATTVVHYSNGNNGLDLYTAEASAIGFTPGIGSNALTVFGYGSTQLYISEALSATAPSAGASDSVSGQVGYYSGNAVARAEVTISDSANSFTPETVYTDNSGQYSVSFTVPDLGVGCDDIIEATANTPGYTGSTSALFLVLSSGQGTCAASNTSGSTTTVTQTTTTTATATSYSLTTQTVTEQSVVTSTVPSGGTTTATMTSTITLPGTTLTVQSPGTTLTVQLPRTTVTIATTQTETIQSNSTGSIAAIGAALIIGLGIVIASVIYTRRRR